MGSMAPSRSDTQDENDATARGFDTFLPEGYNLKVYLEERHV